MILEQYTDPGATLLRPKTQMLILGCLILISLLALIGFVLYTNRQLVVHRQSAFARAEYTSVHHVAQLAREHLRLAVLIQADPASFVPEAFTQQRNLVSSRVNILVNLYQGAYQPNAEPPQLPVYSQEWAVLQPKLDALLANPADLTLRRELSAQFAAMELQVNLMLRGRQLAFEDRVAEWISSSDTLTNLILAASVVFCLLIGLTAYSIFHFLTEQRRSEAALRASENRHRVIVETIPDAVLRVRRDGVLRDYKPATTLATYSSPSDCVGRPLAEVLPGAVAAIYQQAIERTLQSNEPQVFEYQRTDKDEPGLHSFEARSLPSGRDEVQIIVRNVTQEKLAEQRLQQVQKLESLGVLAGGIAHDFNNLLTGMLGQASLAKLRLTKGLPGDEQINKVIATAERAADLTRQLLAYAGKGNFQITQLDLNGLIRENISLLETALPHQPNLHLDLAEPLPPIEADRGQIQQVVMNLVINATEAVRANHGRVWITTRTLQIESTQELAAYMGGALQPDDYVALQVRDDGVGMDSQTLSRIFDPFFSTKTNGHGLGLSATLGIIRTHGGGIQVQSQPGHGATFSILFPIATTKQTERTMQPNPTPAHSPQLRTVLVIDDEPSVRGAVVDILESEGLAVLVAGSGAEGIQAFQQHQAEIGVVLLDMKMPGMSGEETHRALRQINQQVRVILSSGYNESEVNRHWRELGIFAFLRKPYNVDLLLESVYSALTP